MPAPPKKGETKSQFLGRCIPVFIKEGRPNDQAAAICNSMWRKSSKSEEVRDEKDAIKKLQEDLPDDGQTERDTFKLYKITKETIKIRPNSDTESRR